MSRRYTRPYRYVAVVAMMFALVSSLFTGSATAAAQSDPENETGVSGSTYVSPSFGYSFQWDRTWSVADERVESEYNMLQLEDDGSLLYVEGYGAALPVEDCLDEYGINYIEESEGVSELEITDPAEDADGTLSVDLRFVLSFEDDAGEPTETEFAGYLSCREINDDAVNLVVTHLGLASVWDDEVEAREDVLSTLALEGEEPAGGEDEPDDSGEPTEEPDVVDEPDTTSPLTEVQGDGDPPANTDDLLDLFQSSIDDINEFWTREYPLIAGGQPYDPPTEFIPWAGEISTPCGVHQSFDMESGTFGTGPFFCPPNNTIYLDLGFTNFQFEQVGDVPFLIPVVLAHEVGHHVQDVLEMEVCYQTPCLDPNVLTSQEIEYMADCFAGSWSRDAELRGRLGSSDIEANLLQYIVILGGGQEGADPGGHGRGSERVWWFLNGYVEGSAKCYETSDVTADWAQGGPPQDDVEPTPAPEEDPTEESGDPTDDVAGLGDTVDIADGTFSATSAILQDVIENREADGEFLIVYAETFPSDDADGLPFDYEAWTVVDADGNVYEIDTRATDLLLSSAYEDGIDELFEAGAGYGIGLVFDIEPGSEGLLLVNESAGVQIDLEL